MNKAACKVNLILHAHLPFVRHVDYPKFLEENWLFEALNETYIPLLRVLENIDKDNIPFHFTICFSPTLCTMITDAQLQERFVAYMESRIELGEKEIERCSASAPNHLAMATWYKQKAEENLAFYEAYERNILTGFVRLQKKGLIEIMATAATNAYLPLYRNYETAIRAQIDMGLKSHKRFFGSDAEGFWLPECGYYPGLEKQLSEFPIRWIQLPSHSVFTSKNKIESAGFKPIYVGDSDIHGFVRDWSMTNLVWSNTYGYPCDPDYREFYKDVGYELPLEYVRPYVHEPDVRVFTGYKYWAITGGDEPKRDYDMAAANEKVSLHAENFLYHLRRKGLELSGELGEAPIINVCFDADLFGHRWFEGINFLDNLLRLVVNDDIIEFTTPTAILRSDSYTERGYLNDCSWGQGGYADCWLDGSNSWIYRHTQKAIENMEVLAERFPDQPSLKGRFLNQASREVLLAMASDWPYIMHDRTSVTYAEKRLRNHLGSFNVVYSNMCRNAVNTEWLVRSEARNAIFPDMDYNIFRKK